MTTINEQATELFDYDSNFSESLREHPMGIEEAKDFVFSNVVEQLNLTNAKTLSFFWRQPQSYQCEGVLFIEFELNGRHILQIDFYIDENYSEDNGFNGFKIFSEKEWQEIRKMALEDISQYDEFLSHFIANPYKPFISFAHK